MCRAGVCVWFWENFSREVPCVADFFEGGDNGSGVSVTKTHSRTVGVSEVNVSSVLACCNDRLGDVTLFDIHVEEVGKKDNIIEGVIFDVFGSLLKMIDEVCLVAVQRFVNERDIVFRSDLHRRF